ncbi:MAG: hypothetical protein EBS73_15790 [Betaproteobacteria bacterium]|nr:hypothetical protein [Betaproteobacteria bacterium]
MPTVLSDRNFEIVNYRQRQEKRFTKPSDARVSKSKQKRRIDSFPQLLRKASVIIDQAGDPV